MGRRKDILYYDCTNYYFELEEADDLRRYGKSKQHQPLPLVGMGLFMDYDGIPLAFDIFPGNQSEQLTLKPLEKKVISDYGMDQIIVCTDAGLSSKSNRKFNGKSIGCERLRSFITTQSVKQLPAYLKEFALDPDGWHLVGDSSTYNINDINEAEDYHKIYYKDRWIKEDLSQIKIKHGAIPLEQHMIVSFSLKYQQYQRKIRQGQIDRAQKLINNGKYKQRPKNQNDPHRFIGHEVMTDDGEVCSKDIPFLDANVIHEEEKYDGFYSVCTNIENMIMKTEFRARPIYLQKEDRIKAHFITCYISLFVFRILEKKLCGKYTCEEIIHTLRTMMISRPGEKLGYTPSYTRTDLTDALHEAFGFRTDYEITTDIKMKKIIRSTKKK